MKRPARIRVLGKQFVVSFVTSDAAGLRDSPDDNDPGMGRCDPETQSIFIREGQPIESEQDTVLHEVLHAVENAMGLEVDEERVTRLATGLLAVIRDNPGFVRYLATKGKK
ncbi:MAG: hypothetical protein Q8R92_05975 [Deltaproteobacteria bacterium]|nr:hypothetical protein [Deltaproteobacteria bacterium]